MHSYEMDSPSSSRRRASPTSSGASSATPHGVVSSTTLNNHHSRDELSPAPQCGSSGFGCSCHTGYAGTYLLSIKIILEVFLDLSVLKDLIFALPITILCGV